jgi:hypothetical protein
MSHKALVAIDIQNIFTTNRQFSMPVTGAERCRHQKQSHF